MITVILLLIAAVILPSVDSVLNSEQLKSTEATIARLPDKARNDAVRTQNPVQLRFDGSSVIEEEVELNGSIDPLSTINLGDKVQIEQVQKNYATSDPSTWDWTAYPDGTSDSGGIQVSIDTEVKSLTIPTSGEPTWTAGTLPDESQDQWTAGQLLQRS